MADTPIHFPYVSGDESRVAALHQRLIESVEDYAIFALDPQGYILSWNAGAERFKGYKAEEIIGKHFSIFYEPHRIAERFPQFELAEAARVGRFEDEGWRVRKDGTRFWANVVITALRDSGGTLIGYAKVTRDLSERRAAEETLRLSEERFRLLVQGVKDYAIFMLDPTGHVATWNSGAERINSYSADEIIGQHFSKFYPADDIASGKPPRELEVATRTGQYSEEGWRLRKDGSRFWASVLITALRASDGTLVGFAKVTRDLTERRESQERALDDARRVAAEEAARQTADAARSRMERLQNLTAALSAAHTIPGISEVIFGEGMTSIGASAGVLALVDDAAARIQVVGHGGYARLSGKVRNVALDDNLPLSVVVRTGEPLVFYSREERAASFPNIEHLLDPFDATVVLPLMVRGKPTGGLAMHFVDRARLGEDTLELIEAFARQVGQALERARLYEAEQSARARADEANRAKSEFLAAMSHELRTPLNAISGYAELMDMGLRGPVTAEQREDLQRIKRSQQHLLGIINDILNFSRLEAGQTDYNFSLVSMGQVIESVRQMIAPQVGAKGLRFTVNNCADDITAWVDAAKIEQILLNLLSNAVKFTADGEVSISCAVKDDECVEIVVCDSGRGIPADHLEKIFEPFVQVGRSLTSSGEGTGLGLAISRDLARAMRGEIAVQSTLGEGSVFRLLLPRNAASETSGL